MADSRPPGKSSSKANFGSSAGRGGRDRGSSDSQRTGRSDGGRRPNGDRQDGRGSGASPNRSQRHDDGQESGKSDEVEGSVEETPRYRIERVADEKSPRRRNKATKPTRKKRPAVDVSKVDFGSVAGSTRAKLVDRLGEAATAFSADRFGEAERLLLSIDKLSPDVAEVVELLGLARYRQGKWNKAASDLRRFYELTGSVEQHPVRADCARAAEDWTEVERLWKELGAESPEPGLIEEGRIVFAGSLADRGRLTDAIRALEKAPTVKGRPSVHHLRRWYTLGDLYERIGDRSRASRLFGQIVQADADFGDAAQRFAAL